MDRDGDKVRKLKSPAARGASGGLPDYSKGPYRRIRDVMDSGRFEWIPGILKEMYATDQDAEALGRAAIAGTINSTHIERYLRSTEKARALREEEASQKRAAATPRLALPWSADMRPLSKEQVNGP